MRRRSGYSGLLLSLAGISLILCAFLSAYAKQFYFVGVNSGMGDWHFMAIAIGILMLIVGIVSGWVKFL